MTTMTHDPAGLIFTQKPDPPHKYPKEFGIWQMFEEQFHCQPDVVYFSHERMLWVVEIAGTEHTVQ